MAVFILFNFNLFVYKLGSTGFFGELSVNIQLLARIEGIDFVEHLEPVGLSLILALNLGVCSASMFHPYFKM